MNCWQVNVVKFKTIKWMYCISQTYHNRVKIIYIYIHNGILFTNCFVVFAVLRIFMLKTLIDSITEKMNIHSKLSFEKIHDKVPFKMNTHYKALIFYFFKIICRNHYRYKKEFYIDIERTKIYILVKIYIFIKQHNLITIFNIILSLNQ